MNGTAAQSWGAGQADSAVDSCGAATDQKVHRVQRRGNQEAGSEPYQWLLTCRYVEDAKWRPSVTFTTAARNDARNGDQARRRIRATKLTTQSQNRRMHWVSGTSTYIRTQTGWKVVTATGCQTIEDAAHCVQSVLPEQLWPNVLSHVRKAADCPSHKWLINDR